MTAPPVVARTMEFGVQTITLVERVESAPDRLGNVRYTEVEYEVPGCRHRPLTAQEQTSYGFQDILTVRVWKTTAPPLAAVLKAKPDWLIRVDGVDSKIIDGPKVFTDNTSERPYYASILSERREWGG